jgi:hypothetical protein
LDSVNSISSVLPAEGEVEKFASVIYQFYLSNKDNAFSTVMARMFEDAQNHPDILKTAKDHRHSRWLEEGAVQEVTGSPL